MHAAHVHTLLHALVLALAKCFELGAGIGGVASDQLLAAKAAAMVAAAQINANIATGGIPTAIPTVNALVSTWEGGGGGQGLVLRGRGDGYMEYRRLT